MNALTNYFPVVWIIGLGGRLTDLLGDILMIERDFSD